jgi:hypothetical protein
MSQGRYRVAVVPLPHVARYCGEHCIWRIDHCYALPQSGLKNTEYEDAIKTHLWLTATSPMSPTYFATKPSNPMHEQFVQFAEDAMLATAARVWEGPCPKQQSGS